MNTTASALVEARSKSAGNSASELNVMSELVAPICAAPSCTPCQATPAGVQSAGTPICATRVTDPTRLGVLLGSAVTVEMLVTAEGLAVGAGDGVGPPEKMPQPATRVAAEKMATVLAIGLALAVRFRIVSSGDERPGDCRESRGAAPRRAGPRRAS